MLLTHKLPIKPLLITGLVLGAAQQPLQASAGLPAVKTAVTLATLAGLSTFNTDNPNKAKYFASGAACALGYSTLNMLLADKFDPITFGNTIKGVGYSAIATGVLAYLWSMRGAAKEQLNISFNGGQTVKLEEYAIPVKRFAAWTLFTGALTGGILAHHLSC